MHTFGFLGVSAVFLFVMFLRTRRLGHVRLYGVIRLTGLIHTEKKIHAQGNKIQPLVKVSKGALWPLERKQTLYLLGLIFMLLCFYVALKCLFPLQLLVVGFP